MRIFIIAILAILAGCSSSPVDTGDNGTNDTTTDNVYLIVGRDRTTEGACDNRPMKIFACGSMITMLWQEDPPDSLVVPRNTLVTAKWQSSCSSTPGADSIYVISDTTWFVNRNY